MGGSKKTSSGVHRLGPEEQTQRSSRLEEQFQAIADRAGSPIVAVKFRGKWYKAKKPIQPRREGDSALQLANEHPICKAFLKRSDAQSLLAQMRDPSVPRGLLKLVLAELWEQGETEVDQTLQLVLDYAESERNSQALMFLELLLEHIDLPPEEWADLPENGPIEELAEAVKDLAPYWGKIWHTLEPSPFVLKVEAAERRESMRRRRTSSAKT